MAWFEILVGIFCTIAFGCCVILIPVFIIDGIDKLVEKRRRKKHPDYFTYWDKAKILSFRRAEEFNQRNGRIQHYIKMYSDGLRDGECDSEYYHKHMTMRMTEFEELCDWFNNAGKPIDELLHKADQYAKEHSLKWGIIYEDKCA